MTTHDVFISSRPKARQSTMCIVIKGIEKFITNIYDARYELLKLTSDRVIAAIPQTYYGPNDMAHFKDSSISQLVAASMTYSAMSPIQVPQASWQSMAPEMSWRSRIPHPTSPLTTSMLHQHNQMNQTSIPIPSININNVSDLHTSGYSTFHSENSMLKSGSSMNGGSHNSSPENSVNYAAKYSPSMMTYHESPSQTQMRQALNDSMMYGLDPRVIAGIAAMNISPRQGETRTPTSGCKFNLIVLQINY